MKSNFFKHFLTIIVFAIITISYCWPILDGKKINQSDFKQFLGMSKEIVDHRSETGEEALWTNSMFSGMPAYQISVHYSNNILTKIDRLMQLYLPRPVGIIFLYFIGFYILLLSLKLNHQFSFLGALAFGLSTYFFIIVEVGHNTKAHAISYMAPSLAGMLITFRDNNSSIFSKLSGFFISFLFLGLHLRANHLQITYYLLFILFAFWIYNLYLSFNSKKLTNFFRSTFVFVVAGLFAILINIGNIWSTYEYSKFTTRGQSELSKKSENQTSGLDKDYATSYSYGKLESFNMFYPNFVGGSSIGKLTDKSKTYKALRSNGISKRDSNSFIQNVPLYFGPQEFTAGPVYLGAVVWLLFFISLFTLKKPIKFTLLSLLIISLLLAWGRYFMPLSNLMLDYFPLYNKFRTVSMILVIVEFVVPLMAILGLHSFFKAKFKDRDRLNILLKSTAFLGILSLIFLVFGRVLFDFSSAVDSQLPNWLSKSIQEDRFLMFKSDILRSLVFVMMSSIIIFLQIKNYFKKSLSWIYFLAFIILMDMWFVNKRYFNIDSFVDKSLVEQPFKKQEYDKIIHQDSTTFRVYNLNERLDQGARTSYFHHSLGGYHGAKLGKYQEIMDSYLSKGTMPVINMLNAKYIISTDNNKPFVQINPEACGNAWFVENIIWAKNKDEEFSLLSEFDPSSSAIVNEKYRPLMQNFENDVNNKINLTSYKPNKLVYNVNCNSNSLIAFSEIYYPKGWNAYIDGSFVEHFSINYLLRGIFIPKGSKEILFEFKPNSFHVSAIISLVMSIVLILVGFYLFFKKIIKSK